MLLVKFTDLSEAEQRRAGPYLLYFINGKAKSSCSLECCLRLPYARG